MIFLGNKPASRQRVPGTWAVVFAAWGAAAAVAQSVFVHVLGSSYAGVMAGTQGKVLVGSAALVFTVPILRRIRRGLRRQLAPFSAALALGCGFGLASLALEALFGAA